MSRQRASRGSRRPRVVLVQEDGITAPCGHAGECRFRRRKMLLTCYIFMQGLQGFVCTVVGRAAWRGWQLEGGLGVVVPACVWVSRWVGRRQWPMAAMAAMAGSGRAPTTDCHVAARRPQARRLQQPASLISMAPGLSIYLAIYIYRSETDRPHQRLRAITFDVVNRFSKTRRISRALAVPHPWVRAAYLAPPASFSSGLRPALVRCQVAQGPRSRAGFAARGGGGGAGMALGSASARLEYVSLARRWICDFAFSLYTKHGFDKTPPLLREFLSAKWHAVSMRHTMPPCPA